MYRDITMKEISEQHIGQTLQVAGWVENIRDHGGVSFIDLRDMYGTLQVVMRDTTLLDGISKEMCISIEGLVEKRDEDTYNPKLPTGTIELEAKKVTVLGKVYQQLPSSPTTRSIMPMAKFPAPTPVMVLYALSFIWIPPVFSIYFHFSLFFFFYSSRILFPRIMREQRYCSVPYCR